jgi:hypothetical protein
MRRFAIALLLCPLIGASAWAQDAQAPLSNPLISYILM